MIIDEKIKEKFGKKYIFAESIGIAPKNITTKLKTVRSKIRWIDDFLTPLGLEVRIVEKPKNC